jgi:DNA segregation ATPase FtsK/SpoIIIE, S-DNA-T family
LPVQPDAAAPVELATIVTETRPARIAHELIALGLVALSIYILISLVSRDVGREPNLGGPLGAGLARMLEWVFGFQAYVLAGLMASLSWAAWAATPTRTLVRESAGGLLLLVSLSVAAGLSTIPGMAPGGIAGGAIAAALRARLDFGGGYLVVLLTVVGALALIAGRAPTELASLFANLARKRPRAFVQTEPLIESSKHRSAATPDATSGFSSPLKDAFTGTFPVETTASHIVEPQLRSTKAASNYKLPPLELLDDPPLEHAKFDEAALQQSARLLEQKLSGFGVQGQVVEVQPGPVVTMYKLEPGEGVKVSQIVNLADDLSLALRAASVRILAPVPGEAVVGIEVPNRRREKVYLREILEA